MVASDSKHFSISVLHWLLSLLTSTTYSVITSKRNWFWTSGTHPGTFPTSAGRGPCSDLASFGVNFFFYLPSPVRLLKALQASLPPCTPLTSLCPTPNQKRPHSEQSCAGGRRQEAGCVFLSILSPGSDQDHLPWQDTEGNPEVVKLWSHEKKNLFLLYNWCSSKIWRFSWAQWLVPRIPVTREAEIRRTMVLGQPTQKIIETPSQATS
jgi:hypothetical protein